MLRKVLFLCAIFLLINIASSYQDLEFGKCYFSPSIFYVTEDKSYTVKWNGDSVSSSCTLTFHGYDSDTVLDEFKVCVRATTWEINNDDVKLNYYSDKNVLTDNLKQTYTKFSTNKPTTTWCSDSEDYVDIKLNTAPYRFGHLSDNQGHITLEITAIKTLDYGTFVAWCVGGVFGGLALIAFISVIVIYACCRKTKGQTGQVISTSNTTTPQGNAYQLSGGFGNASYPAAPPPYSTYMQTAYPGTTTHNGGNKQFQPEISQSATNSNTEKK